MRPASKRITILLIMNKFFISLLAGALMSSNADARLWTGLPYKMKHDISTDKYWHLGVETDRSSNASLDWDTFFTAVENDVDCKARMKIFMDNCDLGGFMALNAADAAGSGMSDLNGDGYFDVTEFVSGTNCVLGTGGGLAESADHLRGLEENDFQYDGYDDESMYDYCADGTTPYGFYDDQTVYHQVCCDSQEFLYCETDYDCGCQHIDSE
jgi:hypothetical protein